MKSVGFSVVPGIGCGLGHRGWPIRDWRRADSDPGAGGIFRPGTTPVFAAIHNRQLWRQLKAARKSPPVPAENKYDTLGLEASYLAAGQAKRVEEIKQALALCQNLQLRAYDDQRGIEVGALLGLEDENGRQQWLFLAPDAAGLKVDVVGQPVTVITPRSPLGKGLLGKFEGDEVEILVAGARQLFTVTEAK